MYERANSDKPSREAISLTAWFHSRAVAMTTTEIDPTPCWIILTMSHRVSRYNHVSNRINESDILLKKVTN